MLNILIDIKIDFSIPTLLIRGLPKGSLNICELFWGVKRKYVFLEKTQKAAKWKSIYKPTMRMLEKQSNIDTIQSLNCVVGYLNLQMT